MPKFIIHSSEVVHYETEIEAESMQEAEEKFWAMNHSDTTLVPSEAEGWQIDYIASDDELVQFT